MSKTLLRLSQEAKESNILCRNCMKTKLELEKAIVETQCKYQVIIFENDTPICADCLKEHRKQEIINGRVHNQKLALDSYWKNIVFSLTLVLALLLIYTLSL